MVIALLLVLLIALAFAHEGCQNPATATEITDSEKERIAVESYIYGYPLVTMEWTKSVMTNVQKAIGLRAPVGQFVNARHYPDASFRDVTAPNADTLYSVAWLDLSVEPFIFRLPDLKGRYFLMPMLSGWTDVFAVPGTRTSGTGPQNYLITGPEWKGIVPEGLTRIAAPTNLIWILGRIYCDGTPQDYEAVHAIQDQLVLVPQSHEGSYNPEGKVDESLDMKTAVRSQVHSLDASTYFNQLSQLMVSNPPARSEGNILAQMEQIGIVPGRAVDSSKFPEDGARILQLSQKKIMDHFDANPPTNGWLYSLETGSYGTNYLQRAFITAIGLGANLPQDAIYPTAQVDQNGDRLTGINNYVLSFPSGKTPPVKGFWSLTMYDAEYFFVDNPLNRYVVSPRNALKYNSDGSLDILIQHASPGKDKEENWLPAPANDFILMMRFYWPEESLLDGSWLPPAVIKQ